VTQPGDLRRPRIPDEDNAAALWEEAHRWYEEHLRPQPDQVYLYGSPDEEWLEEEARTEIETWLAKGTPYVDLLARAASKPDMWSEQGPDTDVHAIPEIEDATMYLAWRARLPGVAAPESLRELAVMLDLGPKLERTSLIFVLVRWTGDDVAAAAIQAVARKPGFDAREARATLDARFARADDPSDLRMAFRGERVFGLGVSRRWTAGESPLRIRREISPALIAEEEADGTAADRFWASWIARPLAYRDALRLLDLMDRTLALVALPAREALPAVEALPNDYRKGATLSYLFAPAPAHAIRMRLRHEAKVRIARVGLALLALRQETGAWPETLDAVVPLVGEACVEDPYTGERLEYEPGVRLQAVVPKRYPSALPEECVWRFGG